MLNSNFIEQKDMEKGANTDLLCCSGNSAFNVALDRDAGGDQVLSVHAELVVYIVAIRIFDFLK